MDYKSNRNAVYSCKYRVVWRPKYRRRVLVEGIDERLRVILREVAVETRSEILEMEVMPDHVRMLVEVDPQFGIHSPIKPMKGRHLSRAISDVGWGLFVQMLKYKAERAGKHFVQIGRFVATSQTCSA